MKRILLFTLFTLVLSLVLVGSTESAQAQNDPSILLKIAEQAQSQLDNQINQDSPDAVKQLFNNGTKKVKALEESISTKNRTVANENFLSAMSIFKQVSQQLANTTKSEQETLKTTVQDSSADLRRIQEYANNLKAIAKKYNAQIEFSELDNLFTIAKKQNTNKQFDDSLLTINKIKQIIVELNAEIREQSSQHEQSQAKRYAQTYIEQLDRLIENAKTQKLSEDIIKQLIAARENLSLATDPQEIIKEVREIISIKQQFELTKNDRVESRVLQVEKTLIKLSDSNKISESKLKDANITLQTIKRLLSQGEIEMANELLRSLSSLLE